MFAVLAFETPDLQAEPYEQAYVNFPKALKCVSNYRRLSILNFNIFFPLRPCGYDIIEIP